MRRAGGNGARPQLPAARQEVAPEMSAGDGGHEIHQEVRDEQPSEEEMPAASHCEIAPARPKIQERYRRRSANLHFSWGLQAKGLVFLLLGLLAH